MSILVYDEIWARDPRKLAPRKLPLAASRIAPYWRQNMRICLCPGVNKSGFRSVLGTSPSLHNHAGSNITGTSDDAVTLIASNSGMAFDFGNGTAELSNSTGDLDNTSLTGLVWVGVNGNDTEARARNFTRNIMTGTSIGSRLVCGRGNGLAEFQLLSSVTYNSTTYTTCGPNRKEGVMVWQFQDSASGLTLEGWSDGLQYVNASAGSANVGGPTVITLSSAAISSQMTRYIYMYVEWLGRMFSSSDLFELSKDPSIIWEPI